MATDDTDHRYWHIEHTTVDHVEPENVPVHWVDIVRDVDDTDALLAKLRPILDSTTGHGDTYAVHLRVIGSDIRNSRIYSESQPLAVAMGEANQAKARNEALAIKCSTLIGDKKVLGESYEREIQIMEQKLSGRAQQIDRLELRLDRLRYRARRDIECCVTMDPLEVLHIVDGREDDSAVVSAEAMRERLLEILPTEPMGEKFNSDNQYKAALAEWSVYEQIAEILGVELPTIEKVLGATDE